MRIEPVKWPMQVRQLLLSERVSDMKEAKKIIGLHDVVDPFGESTFDLEAPSLSSFADLSEHAKLNTFMRVYFKEAIVGLISEGARSANTVLSLARAGLEKYEHFDPFDCSELARDAVASFKKCWVWLELLLDDTIGSSHKDTLRWGRRYWLLVI